MIYLKIDVADVTRKPFPVTSEIYVFYKYLENASRNGLSLYLRCLLMVLEINKAIMYLKIRSSFTITKKKRQNTPNVPELGGMTHITIYIIPMRSGKDKDRKEDSLIINKLISLNYST